MSAPTLKVSESSLERLTGIVERVTYHNAETGWTVLKVASFRDPSRLVPVLVHQAQVYAGATMEFWGSFGHHPKHGEQFKAVKAIEKKPSTTAALEKYIGSGLIKGVGPTIARRIVSHFKDRTLDVFESRIDDLMTVPGIAERKLAMIKVSWSEHRSIRDVMMFLQNYGISTLYATKIFKTYGDQAIETVSKNPYRLAHDIYGIGFFSADKIALAMGFERTGVLRIEAAIKHVLSASREEGHCFLTEDQIINGTPELLRESIPCENVKAVLEDLLARDEVKQRMLDLGSGQTEACFYSRGLYFDELTVAKRIKSFLSTELSVDEKRVRTWIRRYCAAHDIQLSDEQAEAVGGIIGQPFSVLTGGPGCGKTTTTRVLVRLAEAMGKKVLLAAPTGRAAQRMTEVIGLEARTIHRLLEWNPKEGGFARHEEQPLEGDILVVDETSMLDITLASALLKAVPTGSQVLFIGDPDQLPAVGAGHVLADLLKTKGIPSYRLTRIFRQAESSSIIRFAHEINSGCVPRILSPVASPKAFQMGHDCLFLDADEATADQIKFIHRVRTAFARGQLDQFTVATGDDHLSAILFNPETVDEASVRSPVFTVPEKFKHVDLGRLVSAKDRVDELMEVLKNVHPWSSLRLGMTALDSVIRLVTKTVPEWLGSDVEIQVLTPQVRGSLGTLSLNEALQRAKNPESPQKSQMAIGERILRVGDRVIQTRNNYDLGVFNGDIGYISAVDNLGMKLEVEFSAGEKRVVHYEKEDLSELSLAYAITIHKSQGSEFQVVIIPVLGQHYNMLYRNLIYTGLTRAKKLALFVGTRKAFAMAINQIDNRHRQTALSDLLS